MVASCRAVGAAGLLIRAVAAAVVAAFVVTLDRAPIEWTDDVIYASTALSVLREGSGVPTVTARSPQRVDHTTFYGPVYFGVAAASLDLFGFSMRSYRLIGLTGALVIGIAGMALTAALGGSRNRQWLALVWLLLTPTLGAAATNGRMDAFAVGLELLGIACFVRGCVRSVAPAMHGLATGALLALAALSVPRTLPFTVAFAIAGLALVRMPPLPRRHASIQFAAAWAVMATMMGLWAWRTHGGPWQWAAYLVFLAQHTPADSMMAADAERVWMLAPWGAVTPVFVSLSLVALAVRGWRDGMPPVVRDVVGLPLLAALVNAVLCVLLFNLTFSLKIYFVTPVLSLILALPTEVFGVGRRTIIAAVMVTLMCACVTRAVKYGAVAASWSARDPDALEAFIQANVPSGSDVIGGFAGGFYAVERSGSRFMTLAPESWAAWSHAAVTLAAAGSPPTRVASLDRARFFLWPRAELAEIPAAHRCAIEAAPVALFEPAATHMHLLGPIAPLTGEPGYPPMLLYRVPRGCVPPAA